MSKDSGGGKNDQPSLMQRAHQFLTPHLQKGKETFTGMIQSSRLSLSAMHQDFPQKYPDAAKVMDTVQGSLVHKAKQGQAMVSQQIDSGMQRLGINVTNTGREMVKFKPDAGEYFPQRIQKKIWNYGVDVVADRSTEIIRGAKDFSSGVKDKIVPSIFDRFNPSHLTTLMRYPNLASRYMSQRLQQVRQPLDFYQDPTNFMKGKSAQVKNSFLNWKDRALELDGGFRDKAVHGAKTIVDMAQDKIAPTIGAGLVTYGIYNMAKQRMRTNQAMDSMFPKEKIHGKMARFPLTKFLLTKPISKVMGNPRLSLMIAGYTIATGIGKSISDSMELLQKSPATHRRLTEGNREMIKSSSQLDAIKSINKTRKSTTHSPS